MLQPTSRQTAFQINATVAASSALAVCLVFVLWEILPALLWAGVLVIAAWPSYARLLKWRRSVGWHRAGAPLLFTLLIGLGVAAPVGIAAFELGRETSDVMAWVDEARRNGVAIPDMLRHLPWVGDQFNGWWRENLADPKGAAILFRQIGPAQLMGFTRSVGLEVLHRLLLFIVTLVTVFFLFREGQALATRLTKFGENVFGSRGAPIAHHVVEAIHGTVDGLVLVGLAEGAVIGAGYWIAGVPHTIAFAIATGVLAIIPLGAPMAFCLAGLLLLGIGKVFAAFALVAFGFLTVFITDHIVRPVLIGSASRIPFLLVLLGLLGGISSLGLVGLFVGPALMAVFMVIWRDLAGADRADGIAVTPDGLSQLPSG
jgi:predicted PurR-regulated permease PerM